LKALLLKRRKKMKTKTTKKAAAVKTKISDNPLALRMASVIRRTWNYVGEDFSEMCGGSCSRDEMKEAIFDADRYRMHGGDKEAEAEIKKILDENAWGSKGDEELFSLAFPRR
jgi:hypothetical protein